MSTKGTSKARQAQIYKKIVEENDFSEVDNIFSSIGRGIDRALEILLRNGERNLNHTFNEQEAKDFLDKFK